MRIECGRMQVEVSGDLDAKVDGIDTLVETTEFRGPNIPEPARYVTVAMPRHFDLEDGSRFRVGFNLAPGTYRGDGSYTLAAEGIEVEGPGGTVTTPFGASAFVEVIAPAGSDPPVVRFEEFLRPCELEVEAGGSRGRLECPELGSPDGRSLSLLWSWETVRRP